VRVTGWARERFWLLPAVCAVAAGALGVVVPELDAALARSVAVPFLFGGGPEGARSLLSAVISSMISFTALVFSITIVVLQLTSSQFSPRVLRTFLRDRFNQVTLGVFVATFVYAMTVLRSVRGTAQVSPFVPQIAVTTAFGFVLASVFVFLLYLHHIAQAIRVATIIAAIGAETRDVLEDQHPHDADEPAPRLPSDGAPVHVVAAGRSGVVQGVDLDALAEVAERAGVRVDMLRAVGEFLPAGISTFRVVGAADGSPEPGELLGALSLGRERRQEQDVGFGLRQLVDIACRALSPGVNDPTTAVQVLDQVHDLVRRLATRPLPGRHVAMRDGRVVATVPGPGFGDYLDLAVDEIHHWGRGDPRVRARLRGLLVEVHGAARPEHRAAIADKLAAWDEPPVPRTGGDRAPSDIGLRPARQLTDGSSGG
jgi:uncharacterized membrane protein